MKERAMPASGLLSMFGLSTASFGPDGNIAVQLAPAGVQPGSTGNDNVLAAFSIPANAFDIAGRGIVINAQGSLVNNANTKRLKIIFGATTAVIGSAVSGGTAIADSGSVTTIGGGWSLQASVFKTGNPGSNTQMGLHQQTQLGATVSSLVAPSALTAVESGAILVAVTGAAGTATTDITFNFLQINAMN
jgi:hypothetical protein